MTPKTGMYRRMYISYWFRKIRYPLAQILLVGVSFISIDRSDSEGQSKNDQGEFEKEVSLWIW